MAYGSIDGPLVWTPEWADQATGVVAKPSRRIILGSLKGSALVIPVPNQRISKHLDAVFTKPQQDARVPDDCIVSRFQARWKAATTSTTTIRAAELPQTRSGGAVGVRICQRLEASGRTPELVAYGVNSCNTGPKNMV